MQFSHGKRWQKKNQRLSEQLMDEKLIFASVAKHVFVQKLLRRHLYVHSLENQFIFI